MWRAVVTFFLLFYSVGAPNTGESDNFKPFEFPLHALRGSRVPNQIFKINPNFFN